jgi:dihydroorotase-like cyclic amidohydrolase
MKSLFLLVLVIALTSCLTLQKHEEQYKITSSSLEQSVTDRVIVTISDGSITFRGCNFNFGGAKIVGNDV